MPGLRPVVVVEIEMVCGPIKLAPSTGAIKHIFIE
jgi:hypothetical protein